MSITARSTPDATKVRWITTCQNSYALIDFSVRGSGSLIVEEKSSAGLMAEIATMEAISFIFRPEKSTVPIQSGRSSRLAVSMRETKFS